MAVPTTIDAVIKLRRGPDGERRTIVFDNGEIVFSTDNKKTFIGDGVTMGGFLIGNHNTIGPLPSPSAVEYDLFYDTSATVLYMLTAAGADHINNYAKLSPTYGASLLYKDGILDINPAYFNNPDTGYVHLTGDIINGPITIESTLNVTEAVTFESQLSMSDQRIVNLHDPIQDKDAVNKITMMNVISALSADFLARLNALANSLQSLNNTLTGQYVKKAGDIMTGKLTIQNALSVTGDIVSNRDVTAFST